MKIGKEILRIGDFETKKNKLYRHKSPILLEGVDIEKLLVSNNNSTGEKKL